MANPGELRVLINSVIKEQLEKFQCVRGKLRYQPNVLSFSGIREDGKPVLLWDLNRRLSMLLAQFIDGRDDWTGLTINVDLAGGIFKYDPLSAPQLHQEEKKREKELEEDVEKRRNERRAALGSRTAVFGMELAARVAEALKGSPLYYGHRDYCGMGLELRGGVYHYGEVLDGYMDAVTREFSDRGAFEDWLAQQSDASLARLEKHDPFYWGNQTIDRARLEGFAGFGG